MYSIDMKRNNMQTNFNTGRKWRTYVRTWAKMWKANICVKKYFFIILNIGIVVGTIERIVFDSSTYMHTYFIFINSFIYLFIYLSIYLSIYLFILF